MSSIGPPPSWVKKRVTETVSLNARNQPVRYEASLAAAILAWITHFFPPVDECIIKPQAFLRPTAAHDPDNSFDSQDDEVSPRENGRAEHSILDLAVGKISDRGDITIAVFEYKREEPTGADLTSAQTQLTDYMPKLFTKNHYTGMRGFLVTGPKTTGYLVTAGGIVKKLPTEWNTVELGDKKGPLWDLAKATQSIPQDKIVYSAAVAADISDSD